MSDKLSQTQVDILRHCDNKFWVGYLGWCSRATAESLARKGYFVACNMSRDEFQITDKGREKQATIRMASRVRS